METKEHDKIKNNCSILLEDEEIDMLVNAFNVEIKRLTDRINDEMIKTDKTETEKVQKLKDQLEIIQDGTIYNNELKNVSKGEIQTWITVLNEYNHNIKEIQKEIYKEMIRTLDQALGMIDRYQ